MLPADQRFHADHLAATQIDLRLVVQRPTNLVAGIRLLVRSEVARSLRIHRVDLVEVWKHERARRPYDRGATCEGWSRSVRGHTSNACRSECSPIAHNIGPAAQADSRRLDPRFIAEDRKPAFPLLPALPSTRIPWRRASDRKRTDVSDPWRLARSRMSALRPTYAVSTERAASRCSVSLLSAKLNLLHSASLSYL
jgi:hypothetical protein